MVCDGPSAGRDGGQSQVRAYVYEYHPATKSFGLQVLNFSLTSPSLDATRGSGGGLSYAWQPWTGAGTIGSSQTLPQPMLSDLTFDGAGNMILAFRDRYGDQQGAPDAPTAGGSTNGLYIGEGDLMHACKTASGWSIEGSADCGPPAGEFFSGDDNPNPAEGYEQETGTGGAVVVPGRGEVSSTVIDPFGCLGIGVSTWNVAGGAPTRRYEIGDDYFDRSIPCSAQGGKNTFYKANGIGDLEAMCDAAPLEIGNHVWLDTDRDGIQDPSEAALSGVTVQLLDANGVLLASAITAPDGSYRFPIAAGAAYTVSIPLGQPALAGLSPTRTDASGVPGAGSRDSNGTTAGTIDIATVVAHDPGNSDHTFDFGFVAGTRPGRGGQGGSVADQGGEQDQGRRRRAGDVHARGPQPGPRDCDQREGLRRPPRGDVIRSASGPCSLPKRRRVLVARRPAARRQTADRLHRQDRRNLGHREDQERREKHRGQRPPTLGRPSSAGEEEGRGPKSGVTG